MNINEIRALRRARPFRPFVLVLENGQKLEVDFPYALGISPTGRELSFVSKSQSLVFVKPSEVREVVINGAINNA